ncbi:hypothetical protein AN958_09952 [Leucoagaricus sp. SymC.cos]|nr:hypothetical protein AN958_09952 [Leucoagaricus sp. SymC.cos]
MKDNEKDLEWDGERAAGVEAWEDELEEGLSIHQPAKKCSWTELQEQIKIDLKKKSLLLSQINNFATLLIKGTSQIKASFEIARQWHESSNWGWCKYHYRQAPKKTFKDAKKAAREAFDSCPTDVIHHFINRSWRFMSAYCQGLTGKAAEWAVCKQKGHWAVSHSAMMHIKAIVS